jgi:hypothetical protein
LILVTRNTSENPTATVIDISSDKKGGATFGTCAIYTSIDGADVDVRVLLDSSYAGTWTIRWDLLLSHDLTVTAV